MQDLKVSNPDVGNGVMMPNVVIETANGTKIDTGISYEDIAEIERREKDNGIH